MSNKKIVQIPQKYESQVSDLLVQLMLADRESGSLIEEKKGVDVPNFAFSEGEEKRVTKVYNHEVDEKTGEYFFEVGHRYNETFWAKDSDCDTGCEPLVRQYLRDAGVDVRTVYCFCRVSSERQAGPGHVSHEVQAAELHRMARGLYGPDARVKICKITASAYRSIPQALLDIASCTVQGDAILVYRVDRLSRNLFKGPGTMRPKANRKQQFASMTFLEFLETLSRQGVEIRSFVGALDYSRNPEEFVSRILAAQMESRALGDKIRDSIRFRRARGDEKIGQVPFGKRLVRENGQPNGRLVVQANPEEVALRERVRKMRARMTPQAVADKLNEEGVLKRGRKWSVLMVKNI